MKALLQASKFRVALAAVAAVAALLGAYQWGRGRSPRIVLWAWERPENLEFIDPGRIGVAFLARTIRLELNETLVKPRLQPLRFAPGTELIAVVRIEAEHPALSPAQLDSTVTAIEQLAPLPNVRAIQIDFDAKESERRFYRELLQTLRPRLPARMRLSITALAAWCLHDRWMAGLPIDEAVPMLFRMGVERDEVRAYVAAGRAFRDSLCRNSLGVSTDEPWPRRPARMVDGIYVFNPRPWTAAAVNDVLKEWR